MVGLRIAGSLNRFCPPRKRMRRPVALPFPILSPSPRARTRGLLPLTARYAGGEGPPAVATGRAGAARAYRVEVGNGSRLTPLRGASGMTAEGWWRAKALVAGAFAMAHMAMVRAEAVVRICSAERVALDCFAIARNDGERWIS